ncbi:MAG: excinuclease ABC subunit UvrC [Elusimicrobia bacterium]|nr:excinuclease ABC subunit UvrC [Elusimicrobiota bacterium]
MDDTPRPPDEAGSPDRRHLPHATGVYILRDGTGEILYIGKAIDLAKRVAQYFNPNKEDAKTQALAPLVRRIDYVLCRSEREALLLERRLIHENQPFFNAMWKDGKTYPYLKISLGEDFPRVFTTRRKVRDGGAYFGPYPQVGPVRSLLHYLWTRKIFPLRPCRWEFSRTKPLDPRKIKSCLYYHTKECPAPCAGRISKDDYRTIAERAVMFFKGRYKDLRDEFEREMKAASSRLEYETAAHMRDNARALGLMGERIRVRAVEADDVGGHLAGTRAVTNLQRALGLAAPPAHIEGFDVSHFQGRQTVASMVCFVGGRAHRDHYRKFRIRETPGIDDFKSLREAVLRRYKRLAAEKAGLPDLVLVDGGKGQLGAAQAALAELKLKIPLASLAKRIEEVFLPGRSEALLLPIGSPALSLLQRLRDEAHRFGVAYHRLLRGKNLFGEKPDALIHSASRGGSP